jgi:Na+-translocating ferredoxin:NAD+ oxidoreductase subunit B
MEMIAAIAYLAGLCVLLAALLAMAHRRLWVEEDPRLDVVEQLLPGANCGACGVPGCRAFAQRVIAGEFTPGQCTVGGQATARRVGAYLGIDAGDVEKKVARLLCAGGSDVAVHAAAYEGYSSCRAALTVGGGFKGCTCGCLGLGDCQVACRFDAIMMAPNGLPLVDFEACTGCGDCVRACPKDLFEVLPAAQHLVVQCRSVLAGDTVTMICRVGCNGCSLCAADAPEGLVHMVSNLPVVDTGKLPLQTRAAIQRCPTGAITWIEDQQFEALHRAVEGVTRQSTTS